jgi:hypothetical protein
MLRFTACITIINQSEVAIYQDAPIEKPSKLASQAVKAEYHRLSYQQIELYLASRHCVTAPTWLFLQLTLQVSQHKRLAKFHNSRAKFTHSAPVTPARAGYDLAIYQASGVHQ